MGKKLKLDHDKQASSVETKKSQENKPVSPAGAILQRRNSLQKQREQWVVSDRISPVPPTTPNNPAFIAKKSRPSETVSFSLPPGGFKNQPPPAKSKSLNCQIDELFSQYYPVVNTELETHQLAQEIIDTILHRV